MQKNSTTDSNSFKVYIRLRPFNEQQAPQTLQNDYLHYDQTSIALKVKNEQQTFTFDRVFSPQTSQEHLFEQVADDVVDNAFLGINGTIFCYGQTSSGKTHTIVGDYAKGSSSQGLVPRVLREVIQRKNTKIENVKESNLDIRVKVSMVQIYNEKVRDLFDLSKKDLKLRQNKKQGVFIENVTQKYIINLSQALSLVQSGLVNRTIGKTNLNAYSSRSHMIFIVSIHETNFLTKQAKSAKITLTDLAGSQKISRTGVQGKMLLEAKKINTSLSTLGKVIHALSDKAVHIPYRDSKLTRLLQESIGGNSLTCLIINISPSPLNEYQTVTSLRFGSRAKMIKNKPKVNKQYTVQELLSLLEKAQLKIKQQKKIIDEFQAQFGSSFKTNFRRNGGYAGLGLDYINQKPITLHMIGDDDEDFDDTSSVGSRSIVKSVLSQQDNCNLSIFGDSTNVFFSNTAQFQFQPSSKAKRKANLSYCKSLKALPVDDNQYKDIEDLEENNRAHKRSQKCVTIIDMQGQMDSNEGNGIIYEENQSCKDSSMKNSSTFLPEDIPSLSQLPPSEINSGQHEEERQNTIRMTLKPIENANKQNDQDFTKEKEDLITNLKEQLTQQLKESLRVQFTSQVQALESKVKKLDDQLKITTQKLQESQKNCQCSRKELQQHRKLIRSKDVQIGELKEKYKAKKTQINRQINKLKSFWQASTPSVEANQFRAL